MCMWNELTIEELQDLVITLEKEKFALGRMADMGVLDSRLTSTVSTLNKARLALGSRIEQRNNEIK